MRKCEACDGIGGKVIRGSQVVDGKDRIIICVNCDGLGKEKRRLSIVSMIKNAERMSKLL